MRIERTLLIVVLASAITSVATVGIMQTLPGFRVPGPSSTPQPEQPSNFAPQTNQEKTVTDVVAAASPAVVSIIASKDLPIIERYFESPFPNDPFFNDFGPFFGIPKERQQGTQHRQVAAGTGFIVDASGIILTNRHVVAIEGADFTVILPSGDRLKATVLAQDPVEDLAVLKIDAQGLTVIPLGDSDAIRVGQTAIAIGNALGQFQNTVSVGVVSGLARRITAGEQDTGQSEVIENAIQTDAAINEGNSGGPLLNLKGEAIGINTAIVQGSQNIGFAIPINKAKRALESVKTSGKITYAFLGVRHVLVTQEIKGARGLSVDYGALVTGSEDGKQPGVQPGSPAAQAGIREGDIVLEVNGQKVDAQHSLAQLIQQRKVGETVELKVLSGSEIKNVQATLTERK